MVKDPRQEPRRQGRGVRPRLGLPREEGLALEERHAVPHLAAEARDELEDQPRRMGEALQGSGDATRLSHVGRGPADGYRGGTACRPEASTGGNYNGACGLKKQARKAKRRQDLSSGG